MKRFRAAAFAVVLGALALPRGTAAQGIQFSGYTWNVKSSSGRVGPGPNYFSASPSNVWVDAAGKLHLKITKRNNRWQCAEVVNSQSLGAGSYRFTVETAVDALDPNVVLGLFTWNDDPAYNHREIDTEFSRWASATNQNAQYVVQPYSLSTNIHRFNEPPGVGFTTHSFDWRAASVFFQSLAGFYSATPAPSTILQQWTETNGVPVPGGENARMNLWLYRGRAPTNRNEVEIVFDRFEFAATP